MAQVYLVFKWFLILIELLVVTGCMSTREMPAGTVSKVPGWKNLYHFHSGDSMWIVKPVTETGNRFTGIIYKSEEIRKNRQVHIYAEPLSAVSIVDGKLSVPMENIIKVENHKIGPFAVIAAVCVAGLLFLVPVVL